MQNATISFGSSPSPHLPRAASDLGSSVLGEFNRFRTMIDDLPPVSGGPRTLQTDKGRVTGWVSDAPFHEDDVTLYMNPINDRDILVDYELKNVALKAGTPVEQVVTRTIMYQTQVGDTLDTWERDTSVQVSDGTVLADRAHRAETVYPGMAKDEADQYTGVVVKDDPQPQLSLTTDQIAGLNSWNIAL